MSHLWRTALTRLLKTMVFGTLKTARCADKYGAEKFVLISTDKAVNPTNIMGASKRICEMIIQAYNNRSETEFVAGALRKCARQQRQCYSAFQKADRGGRPRDRYRPRYYTLFYDYTRGGNPCSAGGASAKGGEIFVLDMGKPMKILDLAENLSDCRALFRIRI